MIDYNQPWGWANPQAKANKNNMVAPLGGGNTEGAPTPIMGEPSTQDQLTKAVGGALANTAVDAAAKGWSAAKAAPLATQAGDTLVGGVGNAAEMTGNVSEMASAAAPAAAGLQVLGPLGAAVGGAMKGEYDQAAGAAAGSVIGSMFGGPLGGMLGAKLGGFGGNAIGSIFGLADGTTKVPDKKPTPSIWERLVAKGEEAVKVSTGNDGALGNAKQKLQSRQQRLDEEERKAVGYADGSFGVGGKGMGGPQGGFGTVLNRPFGSTAPTGYYGNTGTVAAPTGIARWTPGNFTPANQPAPIAGAGGGGWGW